MAPPAGDEEDEEPPALRVLLDRGLRPHAQGLSRKKAKAVIDAARLVRSPDHAESSMWLLTDGETVLGTVMPSYGGVSRAGRNGWIGKVNGTKVGPYPHQPTRDAAAGDVIFAWQRIVTAKPRTSLTGESA